MRFLFHIALAALLTALSQIGGLAWLIALAFKRRIAAFALAYAALLLAAMLLAPQFGRVPLSCLANGPLQVHNPLYCALSRNYVTPQTKAALQSFAEDMDRIHPGTITQVLDANFPFADGFPLLPHLSHHDGKKADIAFYYRDESGYLPGKTRSLIGYFAFEKGPTDCPERWPTLRWDLEWLQPLARDLALDEPRMKTALESLTQDSRIEKIFIEPHLKARLGQFSSRIRFQGCRAARHDDHIHIQTR